MSLPKAVRFWQDHLRFKQERCNCASLISSSFSIATSNPNPTGTNYEKNRHNQR